IMKMAKQGGVQFGLSMRQSSYARIIEEEFRSRVMGKDEADSGSVSVRTAVSIENHGGVPNLVIFVFIYNRNVVNEPFGRGFAKDLDIQFSMQLASDIEKMHDLYVARKFATNDEKYISTFTNTAVEY